MLFLINTPDFNSIDLFPTFAILGLCVVSIIVILKSLLILLKRSINFVEFFSSKLPEGSSANNIFGLLTIDLIIATLCLSPPETSDGYLSFILSNPKSSIN